MSIKNDLNDAARNEQKSGDVKYRLGKLILLNFHEMGMISKAEFCAMRDKLIDEYKPTIGELERGAVWVKNELEE